jgi:hypothetical protein
LTTYQQYARNKFGSSCRVALAIQRAENPRGACETYRYNSDGTLESEGTLFVYAGGTGVGLGPAIELPEIGADATGKAIASELGGSRFYQGLGLRLHSDLSDVTLEDLSAAILRAGARGLNPNSVDFVMADLDSRRSEPLPRIFSWLLEEYVIGQHLRVAAQKLAYEGIDTFWFCASEDGYRLHPERDISKSAPSYSGPKLWAARICLHDLNLIEIRRDSSSRCTREGRAALERVLRSTPTA